MSRTLQRMLDYESREAGSRFLEQTRAKHSHMGLSAARMVMNRINNQTRNGTDQGIRSIY